MSKTDQAAAQAATEPAPESNPEDATMEQIRAAILAPEPSAATPLTALETLRVNGREPLTIWKTKGPKSVGGEIAAVLCQDDNTIVLVHTLPSGKWSVFTKAVIS